jgi:uncharacterized protein with von Willebrand factor type A (vWA) domain
MLFRRLDLEQWAVEEPSQPATIIEPETAPVLDLGYSNAPIATAPATTRDVALPAVPPLPLRSSLRVVLAPQFPLSERVIAQSFRRLRRPSRYGPPVELDIEATIRERSRLGTVGPPVLVPRRRNRARLLLLVDRQGSMAPFEPYLRHLEQAITRKAALERVWVAHFHDCPVDGADASLMSRLPPGLFPVLDPVLSDIPADDTGTVFRDRGLLEPMPLADLLDEVGEGIGVAVISDAGAMRGGYDVMRQVATVAFAREIRRRGHAMVWLNPVPRAEWARTTAAELARHLPMFPLDVAGLHGAVEVLRGRPATLARPA